MSSNLHTTLESIKQRFPGVMTWHITSLNGDVISSSEASRIVPAASTRKLSILAACCSKLGSTNPREVTIALTPTDKIITSPWKAGVLQHTTISSLTLWDLFVFMMTLSDESATADLCRWVGGITIINTYCYEIGLVNTHHRYAIPKVYGATNPQYLNLVTVTTVRDSAYLMRAIMTHSHVLNISEVGMRSIHAILNLTHVTLGEWLPESIKVIGKSGTSERGVMNVGCLIINTHPTCIISVYFDEYSLTKYRRSLLNTIMAQIGVNVFNAIIRS